MSMRIAVVNNFFPPRAGGSAHMAEELANQFSLRGHDVLVITAMYKDAPASEVNTSGVRIERIPAWKLPQNRFAGNFDIGFTIGTRSYSHISELLTEFAPDIIHQHGQFFDLTWQTGLWAKRQKVPTVLSIHTRLESPLSRFNTFVYRIADAILVAPLMRIHKPLLVIMDKYMRDYANTRYKGCFNGTENIPVGIDPAHIDEGDSKRGKALIGAPSDSKIVLSVGHVIPQRSRVALVRAMPKVLEALPNTKIVIVGGVHHTEFLELAEQLGVTDSLIVMGPQPKQSIPDLFAAADVEVHELEGSGFGTASIEALASGTPVVAAVEHDNFLDFELVDRKHLFLVPFKLKGVIVAVDTGALANTLIDVLNDPEKARKQVSKHAEQLVADHLTVETMVNHHLEVFERILHPSAQQNTQ